jgi:ribokinase
VGTVWVVGSLNVDAVVHVLRHPQPGETVLGGPIEQVFGGKGANQAVAAVRAGASVRMIGRVGHDEAGRGYLRQLTAFGVDVTGIVTDPDAPTGIATIAVAAGGENTIIVSPGANGAVSAADLAPLSDAAAGDVVLFQLEIPLEVVARAMVLAHERGARVVLNAAPFAVLPAEILALADPLIVNESEAADLEASGVAAPSLLVTRGADGSAWGPIVEPATRAETVLDTTGAGDTYCGTLAASLAAGADRAAAMRAAAVAAAASVGWPGAQPPRPS